MCAARTCPLECSPIAAGAVPRRAVPEATSSLSESSVPGTERYDVSAVSEASPLEGCDQMVSTAIYTRKEPPLTGQPSLAGEVSSPSSQSVSEMGMSPNQPAPPPVECIMGKPMMAVSNDTHCVLFTDVLEGGEGVWSSLLQKCTISTLHWKIFMWKFFVQMDHVQKFPWDIMYIENI